MVYSGEAPPQLDAAGGSGHKFHLGEVGGTWAFNSSPRQSLAEGPGTGVDEGSPTVQRLRPRSPGQGAGVSPAGEHTRQLGRCMGLTKGTWRVWASVNNIHGSPERAGGETEAQGRNVACSRVRAGRLPLT